MKIIKSATQTAIKSVHQNKLLAVAVSAVLFPSTTLFPSTLLASDMADDSQMISVSDASVATVINKHTYQLPHLAQAPVVDGVMDEPVWQQAVPIELKYENQPGEGVAARVKTLAYMYQDGDSLHVAIKAYDPDPQQIRAAHGKAMHESVEILRYLDHVFPEVRLTPQDDDLRRQMEVWLDEAAKSHEAGVLKYVYANGYGRLPTPRDWAFYQAHIPHRRLFHEQRRQGLVACDRAKAEAVLHEQFSKMETVLAGNDYLVGNDYSLADIAWFPNTLVLRLLGYSFEPFPNVRRWIKRIEARPAFKNGYRKELPPLPLSVVGAIARTIMKIVRKTGQRF